MGSSLSAIKDDEEYYTEICKMLGIKEQYEMYEHFTLLEKAFGVSGKYNLFGIIQNRQDEIRREAYEQGVNAHDLKDMVKGRWVQFQNYDPRNQWFIYRLTSKQQGGVEYEFTVPLDDIGSGILLKEHKAITFMRWIRKAIDEKTLNEVR